MNAWWDAPEYDKRERMHFPAPRLDAPAMRVALTTEASVVEDAKGRPKLVVRNRRRHEALRIFVGPSHF